MTERGGALLFFVGFWRLPMTPPPQMPQTLTILMTEREGVPLSVCRILAPPPPILKYFTILMTVMRDAIIFVGFWRHPMPSNP